MQTVDECSRCSRHFSHPNEYTYTLPLDENSVKVCRSNCRAVLAEKDDKKLKAWLSGVNDWTAE